MCSKASALSAELWIAFDGESVAAPVSKKVAAEVAFAGAPIDERGVGLADRLHEGVDLAVFACGNVGFAWAQVW